MKKRQTAWTPAQIQQWENTRAHGERHFVWFHGVLQWGGFMFCFSLAVFQYSHYRDVFSTEGNLPFRLVLALLVWIYVGHLYGRSRWRENERDYLAQTNRP